MTSMASKGASAEKNSLPMSSSTQLLVSQKQIGDKTIVDMDNIQIQKKHGGLYPRHPHHKRDYPGQGTRP